MKESQAAQGGTAAPGGPERGTRTGEKGDVYVGSAGQRHSRLQKPEKHIGAHVEDSTGQRVAELDSRIWNPINK